MKVLKTVSSHFTLWTKTGCPMKLSRVEHGQYLDGRPGKAMVCCWRRC